MRKIVQITFSGSSAGASLFALCDDGTVWESGAYKLDHPDWKRMPDIPQDGEGGEQAKVERGSTECGECGFDSHRPPAAPDATLDEIARKTVMALTNMDSSDLVTAEIFVKAALIRARETDPALAAVEGERNILFGKLEDADAKLAAVREWRKRWPGLRPPALDELNAILDGKEE